MFIQKGNALFLILIAVALFAALSYAVTQSGRGGSGVDKERAILIGSQIIQFAGNLEQSISRLRLINGCDETEISFANDSDGDGVYFDTDDEYHNPNAPSNLSCHIYHPSGGGLKEIAFQDDWLDQSPAATSYSETWYNHGDGPFYSGAVCVSNIGVVNGTCWNNSIVDEELMVFVPFVSQNVCIEINKALGIPLNTADNNDPYGDNPAYLIRPKFTGTYAETNTTLNAFPFAYNYSGCWKAQGTDPPVDTYHFYSVLIER